MHDKTFDEANAFCASVGGRLCTATEVELGCVRGTGCGHDRDLIWTSDRSVIVPSDETGIGLAANFEQWQDTTTDEPTSEVDTDINVDTASRSTSNEDGTSDGIIAGATVGALFLIVVIITLLVGAQRNRKRLAANRSSINPTPKTANPLHVSVGDHESSFNLTSPRTVELLSGTSSSDLPFEAQRSSSYNDVLGTDM